MVLLDGAAYGEVRSNDFLHDHFARVKGKNANSSLAGRYTTVGLAGRETLLELFGAPVPGPRPVTGGLVFSFPRVGSALEARRLLAEEYGVSSHHELVRRTEPGKPGGRPWYHLVSVDLGADSPVVLFLNEVTPEYYAALGARPGPDGELSRAAYLDGVLGPSSGPETLMADIAGATLRLRPERVRRVATVLGALGYAHDSDGADTMVHDGSIRLRLRPDDTAVEGLTEVEVALTATVDAAEHHFGATCRLAVGPDDRARWSFTPVDPAELRR